MGAKELRIGSFVNYFDDGEYSIISTLDWGYVHLKDASSIEYRFIKSIPLTEEWLLKFGFVKDKKHNNCCDLELENNFYLQGVGYGKSNIKYEVILTDSNDNELTLVKHVHQLQNLYFALTNEELTIK